MIKAPKGFISETDGRVAAFGHPAPAWLFPYADLMTELVCFFVILYALSAALNPEAQKAKEEIEKAVAEGKVSGEVKIDSEGLKISLEEKGGFSHFESGFAELTPGMKEQLDTLSPILTKLAYSNNEIIVQGHTDDVPIHNDYFWSNWELSTSRATTVVEYLVQERRLPAGCMAASGYGENRPLVPNTSPDNRRKNRRIVFWVKNPPLKKVQCAGPQTEGGGAQAPPGDKE